MLRSDVSYPYPIIRPVAIDFNTTVFNDEIKIEVTSDGYRLETHFSVNNESVSEMIASGKLKYSVGITCKSTLLREMHDVDPESDVITIDAGKVHYQVNYIAYIIASEDIPLYLLDDFKDDYKNIDYGLKEGSIVGIGLPRSFKALYEADHIKDAASIIKVSGSDQEKYMRVDLDNPQISVILPQEQCTSYKNCKGRRDKYPLINSVVVIPALMEAISVIGNQEDDDEISQRPWFITLEMEIKRIAKQLNESEDYLYEHPLRTAQIIMDNISGNALKSIEDMN